jgi:HEAT repeat protein
MSHPLLHRLASNDPQERRAACLEATSDPAVEALMEALSERLGDPVKSVGRAASDALVEIGRTFGGVEEPVRQALHSSDPKRRWRAAFTWARLEPPAPRLLPALVDGLGSEDGDVRWASARVIVETGRLHSEVLPLLVGLVRAGESPIVRRMATFALRELAPDRPEAAYVLLEAVSDDDLHVRRAATTAMASLQQPPAPVAERLLEALREDPDAATRRLAAFALGELGASDPRQVPDDTPSALVQARSSDDPDLRRAVERALDRLKAGKR